MLRHFPIFVLLALAACRTNAYSAIPDEELHAKAMTLALPQRYDLYVQVRRSRIPSRPILADDVVALGPSAWKYALRQAVGGGEVELSEALDVLYAFDRRCSSDELELLSAHVDRISSGATAEALKSSVDTLCGAGMPAGD